MKTQTVEKLNQIIEEAMKYSDLPEVQFRREVYGMLKLILERQDELETKLEETKNTVTLK